MPSVRVKRGAGGRPYTVIEDSPLARPASLLAPSHTSAEPVEQRRAVTEGTPEALPAPRRRRGTISSLFQRTSSPPPISPGGLAPPQRRDGTGSEDEWRRSLIADHVMRNQQALRNRASDPRLLSPGRPTSPRDRSSVRSYGTDAPPVDIRLSREDLEGQVGSALSLPEDEQDDDYDDHHHDDIVDHLDVIGMPTSPYMGLSCTNTFVQMPRSLP